MEPVESPYIRLDIEWAASRMGASSSSTQGTLRLPATVTFEKRKQLMRTERQLMKLKSKPRAVDDAPDACNALFDTLVPLKLATVGQNAVEEWMHHVDKNWLKTFWCSSYNPDTVDLGKFDNLTTFLNNALIHRYHHSHVFVSVKR